MESDRWLVSQSFIILVCFKNNACLCADNIENIDDLSAKEHKYSLFPEEYSAFKRQKVGAHVSSLVLLCCDPM
jgi:hypothetical protein